MSKRTLRKIAKGARRVGPEVQRRHPTGTLEASRDNGGVHSTMVSNCDDQPKPCAHEPASLG